MQQSHIIALVCVALVAKAGKCLLLLPACIAQPVPSTGACLQAEYVKDH